jgi:DNA-binding MarR family transcriptional regulator
MNYVLTERERRDYIERRAGPTSASTVVHIKERGQEMLALMRDCVSTVEREWVDHLGIQRFDALRETLRDLSAWLGKLD